MQPFSAELGYWQGPCCIALHRGSCSGNGLSKEVGADVCGHRDLHTDAVSRLQPLKMPSTPKRPPPPRWDITYNMTHVGTQGPEIGARIALCKQPWRKLEFKLLLY